MRSKLFFMAILATLVGCGVEFENLRHKGGPSGSDGDPTALVGSSVGIDTVIGPAPTDGLLTAFAQLDGIAGSGSLEVVAGTSRKPSQLVGYGYLLNAGGGYQGNAQVSVPIRRGEYYRINCVLPEGGWCSNVVVKFTRLDTLAPLGARTSLEQGTIYGPAATDGFVTAFSRLDYAMGGGTLTLLSDSSPSPATPVGRGYMFNDGRTYPNSAQVSVPVKRGSYYKLECSGSQGAGCARQVAFFVPTSQTSLGAPSSFMLNTTYTASADGFLTSFARLDGIAGAGKLVAYLDDQRAPSGYGYLHNDGTYKGTASITIPVNAGQTFRFACEVPSGGYCGDVIGNYYPIGTGSLTAAGGAVFVYGEQAPVSSHSGSSNVFVKNLNGTQQVFAPFGETYRGEITVAVGDVIGNDVPDIVVGNNSGIVHVYDGATGAQVITKAVFAGKLLTHLAIANRKVIAAAGPGPGSAPRVVVWDVYHDNFTASFYAYAQSFGGGVRVAAGDVTGDGIAEIITVPGPGGGPDVRAFDLNGNLIAQWGAYHPGLRTGLYVAAGDVNGDGKADVILSPDKGGSAHVQVFDGANRSLIQSYYAFDSRLTGGAKVAALSFYGNERHNVMAFPGVGGGPRTAVFDGESAIHSTMDLPGIGSINPGFNIAATFSRRPLVAPNLPIAPPVVPVDAAQIVGTWSYPGQYIVFYADGTGINTVVDQPVPRGMRFESGNVAFTWERSTVRSKVINIRSKRFFSRNGYWLGPDAFVNNSDPYFGMAYNLDGDTSYCDPKWNSVTGDMRGPALELGDDGKLYAFRTGGTYSNPCSTLRRELALVRF